MMFKLIDDNILACEINSQAKMNVVPDTYYILRGVRKLRKHIFDHFWPSKYPKFTNRVYLTK